VIEVCTVTGNVSSTFARFQQLFFERQVIAYLFDAAILVGIFVLLFFTL